MNTFEGLALNNKKMIFFFIPVLFGIGILFSQSLDFYKNKFNKYLNLHHQLDNLVLFTNEKIVLKNKFGEDEVTIYANEIPIVSKLLEAENLKNLELFFSNKKNHLLSNRELDSILISINEAYSINKKNHLPLSGIRIAIDPGHFADNMNTAKVEQRLLYFKHKNNGKTDTIKLIEGRLTYETAIVLLEKLKEQGAEVLITRQSPDATAFGISFDQWMILRKNKVLDSLYEIKELSKEKYLKLKSCSNQMFFNLFFREYELLQRAKIINEFNPHMTVIIHYNVDEKNSPWNKPTALNYSMCFIGGAFEDGDLEKMSNKIHFLRLLLTNQIENSEKISGYTMQHFQEKLSVSAAKKDDTKYLQSVCIPASENGVYCRNLLLTRHVMSPLVYGESMCQDNYKECQLLSQKNFDFKGNKISYRIYEVADAYYNAIVRYFTELFLISND